MRLNCKAFFDSVRADPFGGRLSQGQVDGMAAIIECCARHLPGDEPCRTAYCLATALHETAGTMGAVRETLAESDAEAVARLDRAYAAGRLPQVRAAYWRPDAEGRCWFGRGLVQLTHRRNYERLSAATGIDLVANPGRALELDVAAAVLVIGMARGLFTDRRLDQYFHGETADWTGARAIVNGTDRAALVAGYGRAFRRAMR